MSEGKYERGPGENFLIPKPVDEHLRPRRRFVGKPVRRFDVTEIILDGETLERADAHREKRAQIKTMAQKLLEKRRQ